MKSTSKRVPCYGRIHLGIDLVRPEVGGNEALFKVFWHHTDAIVCCAWKVAISADYSWMEIVV